LVSIPAEDNNPAKGKTTIVVAEIHRENKSIEDDKVGPDDLKEENKSEEEDTPGLCLAEVNFNVGISDEESDSSGYLQPVMDEDKKDGDISQEN
jgi:hypothetical protein